MSRAAIEAVFADARSAVERGDWDAFFQFLDRRSLMHIAKNSLGRLVMAEAAPRLLAGLVPEAVVTSLRGKIEAMHTSAASLMQGSDSAGPQRTFHHMRLVEDCERLMNETCATAADLPALAAALERVLRTSQSGGSVSSRLFVDDVLQELSIAGRLARGVRRTSRGHVLDITFVRERGAWRIRLTERATH